MSVQELTRDNFDQTVSAGVTLVDFWAPWCGPCRMQSPVVDEFAGRQDAVKVCKVNVDEQPELAARFGVMSIPTLVVIRDGAVAQRKVGLSQIEEIEAMCQ